MENRQLVIEPGEADLLRDLYRQYLKLGTVTAVRTYLELRQLRSRTNKPFSRGALYHLLSSRLYIGEIAHHGQVYPGQHQPIIDVKTWTAAAEQLQTNNAAPRRRPRATMPSMLTGLVFDAEGVRYTPTHAVKRGKRYRYYTSQSAIQHKEPAGIRRIPAIELENIVQARVRRLVTSPDELIRSLGPDGSDDLRSEAQARAKQWSKLNPDGLSQLVKEILNHVVMRQDSVELRISGGRLRGLVANRKPPAEADRPDHTIRLTCPIRVSKFGAETRILSDCAEPTGALHSPSLVKGIVRARGWYEQIIRGEVASFEDLARRNRVTSPYIPPRISLRIAGAPMGRLCRQRSTTPNLLREAASSYAAGLV